MYRICTAEVCVRSSVRTSSGRPVSPFTGVREIERVLHVARGMFGRHVQRVEAVPLVFDFRPFDDGESHAREDGFHAIAHERQRMATTEPRLATRQGDVEARSLERCALGRRANGFGRLFDALLDVGFETIGAGAALATLFRRDRPEVLQKPRDQSVFAPEVAIADRLHVASLDRALQAR